MRLEEQFDDGDAGHRLRLDVLDVIDRGGQGALGDTGDAIAHLGRGQAVVGPDDADDGDAYLGQDVRRCRAQHERRRQQDHQRHHDIRERTAQRYVD